jgi:hypothetical protein
VQPLAEKWIVASATPPLTRIGKESLQFFESDQPDRESVGALALSETPLTDVLVE